MNANTKLRQKKYYGEEAQRVTLKDCQAANLTISRLFAGQITEEDIVVEAPKRITAILVEDR